MLNFQQGKTTIAFVILSLSITYCFGSSMIESACKHSASIACTEAIESTVLIQRNTGGDCTTVEQESTICYFDKNQIEQCILAVYEIEKCSN